jgi:membrane-associated protease RseP (regulator of RpoE activity)
MIPVRPARSFTAWASLVLTAAALLLVACGAKTIESDEFSKFITVNGTTDTINPLIGTKVEYEIQSLVAKDASREVRHRLVIRFYRSDPFSKIEGAHAQLPFKVAADDTASPLKVERVAASSCGFGNAGCAKQQTVAIALADATLRARVLSGYRIKIAPAEGDEPQILTLTPAMIRHQLIIAATASPFADPPRGVIVVEMVAKSPAEVGGVRAGDVLLAIDAQPIRVTNDIAKIMDGLAPGRAVTLELERAGKPFTATVQL